MQKKTRYILPNLFTGLSFILGIYSILIVATFYNTDSSISKTLIGKSPLIGAAWMIIWCVNLDKLDGLAAKMMKAASGFGAQFDSLADLISFGVAPGILVYFYVKKSSPEWADANFRLLIISLTIYSICTAMRLARYNAKDSEELGAYFLGLPSTFAGGYVALSVILFEKYSLGSYHPNSYYLLPLILIILGVCMVSPLYLPKLVKRESRLINIIQYPLVALGYIFGFAMIFPEFLFSILVIYGIVGFLYCLINRNEINVTQALNDE